MECRGDDSPHHVSRNRKAARAVLVGVIVLFSAACTTLFDSPRGTESELSKKLVKALNDPTSAAGQATPGGFQEVGAVAQGAIKDPAGTATSEFGKRAIDPATNFTKGKAAELGGKINASSQPGDGAAPDETLPDNALTGRVVPSLSFGRYEADMPQLAVQGLDDAEVLVDGKKKVLSGMTRQGRITLIAPGRHYLQVKCPLDPPFSADFHVKKDDLVILRGQCTPLAAPQAAGSKK